jgi:(p)ppGpp synthase/HD superfamily hydrolase
MSFFDHELAIAGAWLHDVLEDTEVKEEELCAAVGTRVTKLVVSVTDEPGANRRERKAKTYPKTRAAGPLAVALKLADRIANVSRCVIDSKAEPSPLLKMYREEYVDFWNALHSTEDGLNDFWTRLRLMLELE